MIDSPKTEKICIDIIFNKAYSSELFSDLPIGFEFLPTKEDKSLLCFEIEFNSALNTTKIGQVMESQKQKLYDWVKEHDEASMKALLLLYGML